MADGATTFPTDSAGTKAAGILDEAGNFWHLRASGTTPVDNTETFSTTAAQLGGASSRLCRFVLVQADPENTDDILVGFSVSQSIRLAPGAGWPFAVGNVNKIYRKSISGTQRINWHAYSVS